MVAKFEQSVAKYGREKNFLTRLSKMAPHQETTLCPHANDDLKGCGKEGVTYVPCFFYHQPFPANGVFVMTSAQRVHHCGDS